jgi:hypothetical protein
MPITLAIDGHTLSGMQAYDLRQLPHPLVTAYTRRRSSGRSSGGHTGEPARTQTACAETALPWLPSITSLSGRGDKSWARPVTDPLATVRASGQHHGLRLLKVGGLMGFCLSPQT